MKPIVYLTLALSITHPLFAQDDIPLLLPEERQTIDSQANAFSEAITPALATAAKSTVRVWAGSRRIAYGTVVGDGTRILSKWSEVARAKGTLRVDISGSEYRTVKATGVYADEDLVVLQVDGSPLKPVSWSMTPPDLGTFLAAPQPDGKLAAFGVVSVLERNLKDTDLAYLGVIGEPGFIGKGVKIREVAEKSGAAAAGLKPGNIITKVGDRSISGLMELKNALVGLAPGATISLLVEENGREQNIKVLLGNRPKLQQFSGARLEQMERMGGAISEVRDSFTHAIQTDMRPKPNQIGGPVVDLKGSVVGITVARADRTRSFVMPASAVVNLLKKEAGNPALAQVRKADDEASLPTVSGPAPRGRTFRGGEERMRRHLSDMQRLMDHMREEMEALERP
jgi:hypothetical protein